MPTAVALAAVLLTIFRRPVATRYSERRRATTIFAILVALQAVHFLEEYGTGFHEQFPQVLRLVPWPSDFFVVFNVTWLALGTAAVIGLAAGYRLAFVPAWFFALAGIANGIGHPLLAVLSGGYFPGLVTSPLVGIAGVLLWRSLNAITEAEETSRLPGSLSST